MHFISGHINLKIEFIGQSDQNNGDLYGGSFSHLDEVTHNRFEFGCWRRKVGTCSIVRTVTALLNVFNISAFLQVKVKRTLGKCWKQKGSRGEAVQTVPASHQRMEPILMSLSILRFTCAAKSTIKKLNVAKISQNVFR